jgi:uncharacterized protein
MSHDAVSARTGEPMRCPTCGSRLVEVDRTGVLIDACPSCRGVWLDRGELDKIVERSVPPEQAAPTAAPQPAATMHREGRGYGGHDYDRSHGGKPYKKRKHWLSELFDD